MGRAFEDPEKLKYNFSAPNLSESADDKKHKIENLLDLVYNY